MDVPLKGDKYTWMNRRIGNHHIHVRLYRMLIYYVWANYHNNIKLEALLKMMSYHSPLLFDFSNTKKNVGSSFSFELIWIRYLNLRDLIEE